MFHKVLAVAALTTAAVHGSDIDVQLIQSYGPPVPSRALEEGIAAWADLPMSTLQYVPPHMRGGRVVLPDRLMQGGTTAEFTCPAYGAGVACDAYVLIFECSPCESQKGTLAETLVADGWERTRCAPKFMTGQPGGAVHLMASYRKSFPAGSSFELVSDEYTSTEWVAFAVDGFSRECNTITDPGVCNEEENFCVYKGYECVVNTCITPGPVYRTGCSECPNDEFGVYESSGSGSGSGSA